MALYVRKDDNRTALQERVAAELQEKLRANQPSDNPDGVDDSRYIEGTKQTTSLAWAWIGIGIAIIVIAVWIIVETTKQ